MAKKILVIALALALSPLPTVRAGPLVGPGPIDLDVYGDARAIWPPRRGSPRPPLPMDLWRPGTPLALRGESPAVIALSHAGNATLGAIAFTESLNSLGKDPNAARNAVGFGIITAIQLWSGWLFLKDVDRGGSSQPSPRQSDR
ncbi:MAG: hypothetical protein HZB91_05480 [Elusimicrobia bacterium]|nr:hypothetical protein [Elusimicrobiota bacterium]